MDDLDRMHRRLVHNIRAGFPDYLARPFEVSELYQVIIPYRHNRRELEIDTIQDYEVALLRLLSGERGYVAADPRMQDALRRELESSNPDTSAYRAYATTQVSLTPAGPMTAIPAPGSRAAADSATASLDYTIAPATNGAPAMAPAPAPAARAEPVPRAAAEPPRPEPAEVAASRPTMPVTAPPAPTAPSSSSSPNPMSTSASNAGFVSTGGGCRYCGGALPDGRRITFCPHCGQNLTVRHCPACGTELEVNWKFCTTCGRSVA
jgi:double zinc ribbon protein